MDRRTVIEVQTRLLLGVVAEIVAMLPDGDGVLRRRVHLAVLALLRPAEAAARRVIAIAATLVTVVPVAMRKAMPAGGVPAGKGAGEPAFALFDRRMSVGPKKVPGSGGNARIRSLDEPYEPSSPTAPDAQPDDIVDGAALLHRIAGLQAALADMPKQGRRLARMLAGGRTRYRRVMRPGRPPGYRARGRRAVDAILADCQSLALMVLAEVAIDDSS